MPDADPNTSVMIGGNSVSLMQLAGINMDDVKEVRRIYLARGKYHFVVEKGILTTKDLNNVTKPEAEFTLKVLQCFAVTQTDNTPEDFVDQSHRHEIIMFEDGEELLGRIKAFLIDIGVQKSGSLQQLLEAAVGVQFNATVAHRPDKNDKDKSYPYLVDGSFIPVAPAAAAMQVQQPATPAVAAPPNPAVPTTPTA